MIHSKKGIDQPQAIIYVFFVMILTICGFYLAYMYMGGLTVHLEFSGYTTRYNADVARIINSPTCFAYEGSYIDPDNDEKYQVYAGVIDWSKISQKIPESCIRGEHPIWLKLEFLDESIDKSVVMYTGEQITEKDLDEKWQAKANRYFVLIKDGSEYYPGVLTMRLKK